MNMLYFFFEEKSYKFVQKCTKIIAVSVAVIKNYAAVKCSPTGRTSFVVFGKAGHEGFLGPGKNTV
jgi:hypothetical protein